ncbi:MAG TPA: hypothetical protein VHV51_03250 [Polyangiaceae bacterium]|jgi:hypothetical protein|nr:hypothetical protein [Polyangiaceae bacterium]
MFPSVRSLRRLIFRLGSCALIGYLALAGSGCSRFTKTKQCRKLIADVNPALDEVLALTDAGAPTVGGAGGATTKASSARYVAAASRYERLAKDLGPLEFSSEQMAKYVAEYAGILNATAQNLRAFASAMDANNYPEEERTSHELERLEVRERGVVSRMDSWCAPDS